MQTRALQYRSDMTLYRHSCSCSLVAGPRGTLFARCDFGFQCSLEKAIFRSSIARSCSIRAVLWCARERSRTCLAISGLRRQSGLCRNIYKESLWSHNRTVTASPLLTSTRRQRRCRRSLRSRSFYSLLWSPCLLRLLRPVPKMPCPRPMQVVSRVDSLRCVPGLCTRLPVRCLCGFSST